jgi:carbamoyl-phosphate synthase large subunit
VKIFEINPRLSGTTSLRAINGYNEVEYLIRTEVLGETNVPIPVVIAGRIERGLTEFRI